MGRSCSAAEYVVRDLEQISSGLDEKRCLISGPRTAHSHGRSASAERDSNLEQGGGNGCIRSLMIISYAWR